MTNAVSADNEISTGFIEADDDTGSGYETNSTGQSVTTSLSSGLQEWLVENGDLPSTMRTS